MRIVSGVQPSNDILHIGNYFGAIKQWLDLQSGKNECFFFIADLHALTEPSSAEELRKRVLSMAKDYIALGLDNRSNLFLQSSIPQHTQLMWLLTTSTALGDLERMTQFKDKSQRATKEEGVNAGLFMYPVLMAADILLYQAEQVPVGDDQFQHLELTREIARRFNHKFGKKDFVFKIPEPYVSTLGGRVMSLNDPSKKMAKSLGADSYIGIFEDKETIKKKLAKAVTDPAGLANLIDIYIMVSDLTSESASPENIAKTYANRFSVLKEDLANKIFDYFSEARNRRTKITDEEVIEILKLGTTKARNEAKKTMEKINGVVGFVDL